MQTMVDKKFSISLTATIAELYEAQRHYFAAYIAYWHLYQTEGREEYHFKLNELKERIYSSAELNYDPTIREIFTDRELKDLGILPDNLYREFAATVANLQRDDQEGTSVIDAEEEDELQRPGKNQGPDWKQIMEEERRIEKMNRQRMASLPVDMSRWEKLKASDLIDFLTELKAQDENLSDVKLSELIESFLKNYELENKFEK